MLILLSQKFGVNDVPVVDFVEIEDETPEKMMVGSF